MRMPNRRPDPSMQRQLSEFTQLPRVHILLPGSVGSHPGYDTAAYRAEMAEWFGPLGLEWDWRPIHLGSIDRALDALMDGQRPVVVFNLCDGDEWDGFPGLSVVRGLEQRRLPFTGAGSEFYELSTSKLAMKAAFEHYGVLCPAGLRITHPSNQAADVRDRVGFPCILKLDSGADGMGLDCRSVVAGTAEFLQRASALLDDPDRQRRGVIAERFMSGQEFTVLLVADANSGARSYWPVEKRFASALPVAEQIMYAGCRDQSDGPPHVIYQPADAAIAPAISTLAMQAFRALNGTGYARVDIRMDPASGKPHVLEVNASCGLGLAEPTVTVGLATDGEPFHTLIAAIIRDALHRHAA